MMKPAPLIKEHRLDRLLASLTCIDEHAFSRARQIDCILGLYPTSRSEKSVVRGMVIPSTRHLGLIVGGGDFIRLSANGKIMVVSSELGDPLRERVFRAVLYEVDQWAFGFVDILVQQSGLTQDTFYGIVRAIVDGPSVKQKDERTRHWLTVLEQVKLVRRGDNGALRICHAEYEQTLQDLDATSKDMLTFKERLFDAYAGLTRGTAAVADIPDLREKVAVAMLLADEKLILTEAQFDHMLAGISFATNEYIISLGRAMGAAEKLFHYRGSYYRTLSIRFLKTREVLP